MNVRSQLYSPAALPPGKTYIVHLTPLSLSQNLVFYGVVITEWRFGKDLEGSGRALTKVLPNMCRD
jgi:hypothetical protein